MALHHDREFIEIADEAEARRAAWRISFIGILAVLLLGVGLVSLLLYGRILSDNGVRRIGFARTGGGTVDRRMASSTPARIVTLSIRATTNPAMLAAWAFNTCAQAVGVGLAGTIGAAFPIIAGANAKTSARSPGFGANGTVKIYFLK